MANDVLIKDGAIVIPNIGVVRKDIYIKNGRIYALTNDRIDADEVINAEGKYILPGLIDPHVHYGVFEPIDRSAEHESRAAAIGGVTCMIRMLRLYGSYKDKLKKHLEASKDHHIVDYAYHASILLKEQIEEIDYCIEQGIRSFKLYMNLKGKIGKIQMDMDPYNDNMIEAYVDTDEELIKDTIRAVANNSCIAIVHAEDPDICLENMDRLKRQGRNDLGAWHEARPSIGEAKAIRFLAKLARDYDCKLYLPHIGSKHALEQAINAKGYANIYIETCPHYLTHTKDFDLRGKVTPPLRCKEDQLALWKALSNDMIDCIGTDHVANRLEDKLASNDLWQALSGFQGLATMLAVMISEGVNKGRITLEQLSRITSYNAAKIFMLKGKGSLEVGYDADLTIIDTKKEQVVKADMLGSYSDYSIYEGMLLRGWPILTMVRGRIVMEDGRIVGRVGYGRYIAR